MTRRRPRALLFDWDNTLVDTWESIHEALNATLSAMGHAPWTPEETRTRVRASARDSFPLLFGERAAEAMGIYFKNYEATHLNRLQASPGADLAIKALAEDGLYLAVVSSKQGRILRAEADHLGWTSYFSRLVGANDAKRDKPAVEAVELALRGSGIARGPEVWFIGDTDIDMICAVNAGCLPVLLRVVPPAKGEFPGAEPSHHVAGFSELTELLDSV